MDLHLRALFVGELLSENDFSGELPVYTENDLGSFLSGYKEDSCLKWYI
jgi:hypothetical protein